jgi:hypothetical protein
VIVMPGNTKLDQPEDVERAIACARDAFGEQRPIFVIDTWSAVSPAIPTQPRTSTQP